MEPPSETPAHALSLLLVDDEEVIHHSIGGFLERLGYTVHHAYSGAEGLEVYRRLGADIVITDIRMGDLDGLALLESLRQEDGELEVIFITGHGDMDSAIHALRHGAFDFFHKPVRLEELIASLQRTRAYGRALAGPSPSAARPPTDDAAPDAFAPLIGQSEPMLRLQDLVHRVASTDRTTVLIQGESGTGKELVARAIHRLSGRRQAPFAVVNATAIPDTLFESELFGHEKGAFTDAKSTRKGLFEQSRGGTLFLDEIGDLSPASQAKILRVLEERSIRRVGGGSEINVDVRLVTATHQDLNSLIDRGAFRQDLYFRLNVFTLALPPLRERGGDLLLLARHFLALYAAEFGKKVQDLSPEAIEALCAYPFPGNVRELRNLIERAVILCDGPTLTPAEFANLDSPATPPPPAAALAETLEISRLEEEAIRRALERTGNNQTEAARLLGIGHDALRYRIKKYGI